ncbi:MAG: VanZ family protein [Burkholderiales bacterium]|nr:VanZ family protein [Burkholderiales bacterium]
MSAEPRSRLALYLALGYTLLILYASLAPFSGWRDPGQSPFDFLREPWPRYVAAFDIAVNVLAYVPFGMLVAAAVLPGRTALSAGIAGFVAGVALSFAMECAQGFLPSRIASRLDLVTNMAGAGIGAWIGAHAGSVPRVVRALAEFRQRWFLPGGTIDLGIALIGLWLFSQLDPSLPLLGIVFFSDGVQAQLAGIVGGTTHRLLGPISVAMNLVSLGLLLTLVMRSKRAALAALALLVSVAALTKLIAASLLLRSEAAFLWVSREVVWAIIAGMLFVGAGWTLPRASIRTLCAVSLVCAIALSVLRPGEAQSFLSLRLFRWNDLQLVHYTGLSATVAEGWPYAALLYLALLWRRDRVLV